MGARGEEKLARLWEEKLPLLAAACDWLFLTDVNLTIQYCHRSETARMDNAPHELIGVPLEQLFTDQCRDEVMTALAPENILPHYGAEVIYADAVMGVQMAKAIALEKGNELIGYAISIRSVSVQTMARLNALTATVQQKDSQDTWQEQAAQQEIIMEISSEFYRQSDRTELLPQVLRTMGTYLKADWCSIYQRDVEEVSYSAVYEWYTAGVSPLKAFFQRIPFEQHAASHTKIKARPYIAIDDLAQTGEELYAPQKEAGIGAMVRVPLIVDEAIWGTLGVDCADARNWSDGDLRLIQSIAMIIAAALERSTMEDKLHDAFSKLSEVVSNYPGIIWAIDTQGVFTLMEGQALRSFGLEGGALLGITSDQLQQWGLESLLERQRATFEKGDQSYSFDVMGRHFACETTLMRRKDGQVSGLLGVALDITQTHEIQRKLEVAIQEAEAASQAKTEFLSRMSHEIRTPMNAIIGMNEIAKKSKDPDRVQYCLLKIEQASRQLLGLINDILDLSKIESGKMEITYEGFDFEKMLQNVYQVVQPRVEEKNLDFRFDLDEMCSRAVISDELRMTQVVTNLLSNAVKFTPDDGGISLKSRFLKREKDEMLLRVEVHDTGIGISKEEQGKLFKSFEQADGSITRRFGGTGLGLSICKRIMDLMGGAIWVESEPGEGSTFIFEVPVKLGNTCERATKLLPDMRDVHVLVVDDTPETLEYTQQIIRGFQMHCDVAPDGRTAIQRTQASIDRGVAYDIIFLDWKMPEMDGIETARHICQIVPPETIVIMISVADWADMRDQAESIGVKRFLPKPLLPSMLLETIVELLGKTEEEKSHLKQMADKEYNWTGKRALVAEDIEINREILMTLLEHTGLALTCVENGRQAVEAFCQAEQSFDLILMDVQMPEMDGYEATRCIRASDSPEGKTIPIVAMTANAFVEDVERSVQAGMNSHVAKPIDVDELMEKLDQFLL